MRLIGTSSCSLSNLYPDELIMTTTLAHHYYHQPEVFGYECEHIFKRHWWLVTTEASFAENGDYQTFKLMQWPLLVVRDQQGELRGFYNLCRHRAGPLVDDCLRTAPRFRLPLSRLALRLFRRVTQNAGV